jgi:hypothetical protein
MLIDPLEVPDVGIPGTETGADNWYVAWIVHGWANGSDPQT